MFIYLFIFLLVIHFIHITVYMSITISQFITPTSPLPAVSPLGVHTFFLYVCVSISALQTSSSVPFSTFHIYALIYGICFSLSDLLHSVWQSLDASTYLQLTQFHSFLWLSNIPLYICTKTMYQNFFIHSSWWAFRLLPCPGYCKQCCNEYCGTCLFLNYGFLRVYVQ